jgi:hypothetical protein
MIPVQLTALPGDQVECGGYFLIDKLTAPGYYDIETICPGGSSDTVLTNIDYRGYLGYQPTGKIINKVTGNVIRGASVSIWHQIDGGGYQLVGSMEAGDGTYSFDVPPGTYKVLAQYELGGEQWQGPFVVEGACVTRASPRLLSPSSITTLMPYQDILVTPVTQDTLGPVYSVLSSERTLVEGKWADGGTGLAVVEVVPGSASNVLISITNYAMGDSTAQFTVALAGADSAGSVTIRAIDQLGNTNLQGISLSAVTGVPIAPVAAILSLASPRPNPTSQDLVVSFSLATSEAARIDLMDISGRIVASRRLAGLRTGGHTLSLRESRSLGPGIYFVRLTQGRRFVTQKVCVLH